MGLCAAGDVNVTYYSEHFGHSCDVAHQQLTRDERTQVAGLLAMGVPYDDVLHRMQLSGDNSSVSRLHFLTKHDLNNITRDFNLSKGITHCTNDADSVAAWVALNQRNGEQSLVRYIKFQGESDEEHGLSADDFMLVIMSEAQIAGLQQLYHPKKEVAMDSTHGTNAYDYQLTTLMTTDEHGEGFPIAFCFSNRVDEVAMRTFLTICKRTIGRSIDDAVLMTDDAEVYANAWVQVMGPPAHRLLCTWHIDRAWRKNLHKIEGDSFLKATVYKTLRAMMEIRDVDIFRERLKEFVEAAASDSKTEKFGIYFHNEYASRPQLWAFCHRLGLRVHHNMHLEALHRVLKHVHMKGQKVRRMDKCIYALLRFMRSKMHDRLLKVHKGKWTRHLSGIRNRHKRGVLCDRSLVSVVRSDQVYAVRGRKGEMYIVEQNDSMPHSSTTCPLRCEPCNICVHTFVCNCVDAGLRYTICKHVHLVVSTFKPVVSCTVEELAWESQPSDTAPSMETESQNEDDDFMSSMSVASEELVRTNRAGSLNESEVILQDFSSQQMQNDVLRDIAAAERDWTSIRAEMDDNAEIAAAVREQMGRLKALVTALKNKPQLRPMSLPQEPTNKKVTKQRYFMSTKRKPKKRNAESTICKPDCKEKQFLLATLAGNVEVVSSARTTTDHNYEADTRDVIAFEHSY